MRIGEVCALTLDDLDWTNEKIRVRRDSGIMKWPTSAVCFGPPLGQSELLVFTERELRTGAGVGLENQGGALRTDSPGV